MTFDELRQPLRKLTLVDRVRARSPNALVLSCLISAAVFGSAGAWVASLPHPYAGEPIVIAAIPPVEQTQTATTEAEVAPEPEAESEPEPLVEDALDLATEPITEPETEADEPRIIFAARRALKSAPIASVSETTADGPLPRIARNGKRPSELYAQTIPLSILASQKPKIAIMLGGMGLNARLTDRAIKQLPGDITFGFAPYGNKLQAKVNAARAEGHEIILQLPMEPLSYPADNPGPNTLLAEAGRDENLKALRWSMARFAGYSGIANYMGSRFLASPEGLKPVLAEMKARGLVFLEDSSPGLSAVPDTARATGLRSRRADLTIDATADGASIKAALARLESIAKTTGLAVGTGSGLEITIDTVIEWADELEAKGILLVPISAAFQGNLS